MSLNLSKTISLSNCIMEYNKANTIGGAIYISNYIGLNIISSIFTNNSANLGTGGSIYLIEGSD